MSNWERVVRGLIAAALVVFAALALGVKGEHSAFVGVCASLVYALVASEGGFRYE